MSMLHVMILSFAVVGLVAGFGAYMISSYLASRQIDVAVRRNAAPAGGLNPWIPAVATFVLVWGVMSLGFLRWVSSLS